MIQRRAIPKSVEEKGLMTRAHGNSQIRGMRGFCRHLALSVMGQVHLCCTEYGEAAHPEHPSQKATGGEQSETICPDLSTSLARMGSITWCENPNSSAAAVEPMSVRTS
jgi:hypothetical protein